MTGLTLFQWQRDAWSGAGGRWVSPVGWRPAADDEWVRARWEQEGRIWSVEGPWPLVRRTLTEQGHWPPSPPAEPAA